MCRQYLRPLVIVLVVLISGAALEAATYYVSPSGRDSNPGTESQPFQTVTYGVGVLKPGDTLLVRAGT
jgi:hypothetical protein